MNNKIILGIIIFVVIVVIIYVSTNSSSESYKSKANKCKNVVCSSGKRCVNGNCVNYEKYVNEPFDVCPENKCGNNTLLYCKSTTGECIVSYLIGNDITAALNSTLTPQRNTKLTKISTNYPDKVIIAQDVTTGPITNASGAVKFSGVTYTTPKFIYYPMFIFTALDQWVTLNSNGARITVQGGTGSDSAEICIVLVQWNETSNSPVTVSDGLIVSRPILGVTKNVPKVTNVLAETAPSTRNGRGTSGNCSGFSNYKVPVPLEIGKTYAIAMQATICTDDYVYMEWDAFSTTIPAVTFSEFE